MKNISSAKIKETRNLLGYSQMELAERTKLSLRTIQRIESGETEPRGDTMKRLSIALNLNNADLVSTQEQDNKPFLLMLNLSALGFVLFSLLGVVIPLILWVIKRDKIEQVDRLGKKLLNFEMTCCALVSILYVITLTTKIMHVGFRIPGTGLNSFNMLFISYYSVYAINVFFIVVNAVRIKYDKPVMFFGAISFLK
jgi:uncharacterized Tic20 family protein